TRIEPFAQNSCWVGASYFVSRPAATVRIFMVEPGSKVSLVARFRRLSSELFVYSFGLYPGQLANARTSPVQGSTTTTEPPVASNVRAALASSCSAAN